MAVGSVLILCAAIAPGGVETMLLKRFPRYLGRLSFSLYLVHVPDNSYVDDPHPWDAVLTPADRVVVPVSIALADGFELW